MQNWGAYKCGGGCVCVCDRGVGRRDLRVSVFRSEKAQDD